MMESDEENQDVVLGNENNAQAIIVHRQERERRHLRMWTCLVESHYG